MLSSFRLGQSVCVTCAIFNASYDAVLRAFYHSVLCAGIGAVLGIGVLHSTATADDAVAAHSDISASRTSVAASRSFTFDYGVTINGFQSGDVVKIWMPVPPSDRYQVVQTVARDLPRQGRDTIEPKYGNKMVFRTLRITDQDQVVANMRYHVRRNEVNASEVNEEPRSLSNDEERLFLAPNAMVPTKQLPIKWKIIDDKFAAARQIYDRVDEHVRYDKSKPGYGNGDVLWVCQSRFGNCTDFHSLFIAMARASNIPARFEIGFPLPADQSSGDIGGYHCWASFFDASRGWFPVDISEADKHPEMKDYFFGHLTPDRVRLTTGRDIDLVPQQQSPSLNYFVYPHVEINGVLAKKDQLRLRFHFQNDSPSKRLPIKPQREESTE